MLKIAVMGANGRMGGSLVRLVSDTSGMRLHAALTEPGHACVGQDAGQLAGLPPIGLAVTDALEDALAGADVVIDFTSAAGFDCQLAAFVRAGVPAVIGTTGLSGAQQGQLEEAARQVGIVYGRNMSLGVAVMTELARLAARLLGDEYDIEIVEAHHRHKQDAPSGTALQLGEALAQARGAELTSLAAPPRHGASCPRVAGEIGFASLRAGGIIGDHSVLFASAEELIQVRHEALDRMLFARGALRAASWLAGQPPGLYAMRDVLGLGDTSVVAS
ncbi:MAG: 4-hydroxy-tetrahydrodipicolinate reductase [Chromatiales bacterium]|nr:4-hydroxy-tetrahydrodipicolinate reductase [Chromatiales bacterium]